MLTIDNSESIVALRDALNSATQVTLSFEFNNAVITGLSRPPTLYEMVVAQVRILGPAIACGACFTFLFMQFTLSTPSSHMVSGDSSPASRTVNVDKLMMLLDKPGQQTASLSLIEQCIELPGSNVSEPAKFERRSSLHAALPFAQNIV